MHFSWNSCQVDVRLLGLLASGYERHYRFVLIYARVVSDS